LPLALALTVALKMLASNSFFALIFLLRLLSDDVDVDVDSDELVQHTVATLCETAFKLTG